MRAGIFLAVVLGMVQVAGCASYTKVTRANGDVHEKIPDPDYGYSKRRYYGPTVGKTTSLLYAREERARIDVSNCRGMVITERPDLIPEYLLRALTCVNGEDYVVEIAGIPLDDGPGPWNDGVRRRGQ